MRLDEFMTRAKAKIGKYRRQAFVFEFVFAPV